MSIGKEIKKGFLITFISKYSNIIFELIISAILARLLTPKEFGIVAVILVFTTFFNLLSDVGIGTAIIQNKALTKLHIQSIFNYSIIIGIISALLFGVGSYFIAEFYQNEIYIRIGWFLSIAVFFYTSDIVPQAIIRKNKEFFKIEGAIVFVNVLTGLIAIYQAYSGYGYYSLVNRAIFKSIFLFCVNFYNSRFIPGRSYNLEGIRLIFSYSSYQFLFNFINYFSRNLDNILIGKYLGSSSLGFYDRAYRLMLYPVQNLTHVITPVLHPILSTYQNEPEIIYSNYKKILELLAFIGMPLSVFLYFTAEEIILIMYGDQWVKSIPVFKILAITVWIQMTLSSAGSIFQALGKTNLLFFAGFVSAIFMVLGILYGIFTQSLEMLSYGLLIAFTINFFQGFGILFFKGFNKPIFHFLKFFKSGAVAAIILFVPLYFFKDSHITIYVSVLFKGILWLISLFLGALLMKKEYVRLLFSKLKRT